MKFLLFATKEFLKKVFNRKTPEIPEELFEKANYLFKKNRTGDAYMYLQIAAINGHPEAAFRIATAILEEKTFGTKEDAVKYLTIASKKNHAKATTNLAICYQFGTGTTVDYSKALQLLNKAIKLGDDMAAFNLGQMYMSGYGVKKNEAKGWNILQSLVKKGNKQAEDYINNLLQKGYTAPDTNNAQSKKTKRKNYKDIAKYKVDYAPECEISDQIVIELYNSVKKGNDLAKEKLMKMAEISFNRDAMNALRKLGLIKEDVSDNFKYGTAQYLINVWKSYDIKPLRVLAIWTYPGFSYREFKGDTMIFETQTENEFVEKIGNEIRNCIKYEIVPRFRIRKVDSSSSYCVDVDIDSVISTFYIDIKDNHYRGLYRVFE